MPPAPRPLPSLRTELLGALAILAAMALLGALASALLFLQFADAPHAVWYLIALVLLDIGVFVLFGAYLLRRLVDRPIAAMASAAEAIAAGDLSRRVPVPPTRELAALAESVNRMTDHLLAEQTQRVRAEKLASVGRLAAGIAHEIGNPLGAIHGYAHLVRRAVERPESADARAWAHAAEAVDGLERESGRIDRIVRGLLDYARPRRLTPGRVDVNDTVRGAVQLLTDQGRLRAVDVALALDERAPALFGGGHELEQVLVNLFLNALDAMDQRGRLGVVTVLVPRDRATVGGARRATDPPRTIIPRRTDERIREWVDRVRPPAEVVKVIVADAGPGVPEADAERIFDPFFTTKEPGRGTGLGLAIVARVVDSLQGVVWVERAREGGAAFHMLFPQAVRGHTPAEGSEVVGTESSA
jgi:signal transduction histidine kinase